MRIYLCGVVEMRKLKGLVGTSFDAEALIRDPKEGEVG